MDAMVGFVSIISQGKGMCGLVVSRLACGVVAAIALYFIGCGAEVVALFLFMCSLSSPSKHRWWLIAVGKIRLHVWWLHQAHSFSCCVAGCSLAL
jgi:hypothetical protein